MSLVPSWCALKGWINKFLQISRMEVTGLMLFHAAQGRVPVPGSIEKAHRRGA